MPAGRFRLSAVIRPKRHGVVSAGSGGVGNLPTAPSAFVDVTPPTVTGTTRTVSDGVMATLQAALNASAYGDEVVVSNGPYDGQLTFSARAGWTTGKYVYLRSSSVSSLPALGSNGLSSDLTTSQPRVYPSRDSSFMPQVRNGISATPALYIGVAAQGLYVRGLQFKMAPSATQTYYMTCLGAAPGDSPAPTAFTDLARNIVLNQCIIQSDETKQVGKGIRVWGQNIAVVNSHIHTCDLSNADSNAVWIGGGQGPFLFDNNLLCGNGENWLTGGGGLPTWHTSIPSDFTITRNRLWKDRKWIPNSVTYNGPWTYGGTSYARASKNIFETKMGYRYNISGNILDGSIDGQDGQGPIFKSQTGGDTPIPSQTAHVLFKNNLMKNVGSGFEIIAWQREYHYNGDGGWYTDPAEAHHIRQENCLHLIGNPAIWTGLGEGNYWGFQAGGGHAFTQDHVTVVGRRAAPCVKLIASLDNATPYLLGGGSEIRNSVYDYNGTSADYTVGVQSARQSTTIFQGPAVSGHFDTTDHFHSNVLIGPLAGQYNGLPDPLFIYATNAAAGLNTDGTLTGGSPLKAGGAAQASDGTDNGVNHTTLNAAIAGVEVANELTGYGAT